MLQLTPYLSFANNCREALEFYHSCFGGEINLMTVGESGMKDHMPAEKHNLIMHGFVKTADFTLMASDMIMGETVNQGDSISLCWNGDNLEQMKEYHAKLSEGAKHVKELKTEFWGATYGEVVDKFGFRWMFNCN